MGVNTRHNASPDQCSSAVILHCSWALGIELKARHNASPNQCSSAAMLQAKMRSLKAHADGLLDSILNHPNLTESQINQMNTTQKEELRLRVKAADDVSHRSSTSALSCIFCFRCLLTALMPPSALP